MTKAARLTKIIEGLAGRDGVTIPTIIALATVLGGIKIFGAPGEIAIEFDSDGSVLSMPDDSGDDE